MYGFPSRATRKALLKPCAPLSLRSPVSSRACAGLCYSASGRWVMEPRRTISFTDLPVSQGARDLMEKVTVYREDGNRADGALFPEEVLDVLAAADEKDVRNLLWARRVGKL
jgi:hypothetical protein